jgi:hypothetical protein
MIFTVILCALAAFAFFVFARLCVNAAALGAHDVAAEALWFLAGVIALGFASL